MSPKKPTQSARKAYTAFLFADLRDFTAFTRIRGDEAAYRLVQRFYRLVTTAVAAHGGSQWKREGDQVLLAFPTAFAAVKAAVSVMRATDQHNANNPADLLMVGIGLDVGEPVAAEGDFIGTAVNRTARITALARAGQVLVSEAVYQLASNLPDIAYSDRGQRELRGFESGQQLYELMWRGGSMPLRAPKAAKAFRFSLHRAARTTLSAAGLAILLVLVIAQDRGIGLAVPSLVVQGVAPKLVPDRETGAVLGEVSPQSAPAEVVVRFHRLIQSGNLGIAYDLVSSNLKSALSPMQLMASYGYLGTVGVQVTDTDLSFQFETTAEVTASVLVSAVVDGEVRTTLYEQRWALMREGNEWRIDELLWSAPKVHQKDRG